MTNKTNSRGKAAFGSEEKIFFLKIVLILIAIYVFKPLIFSYVRLFAFIFPGLLFFYLWAKSIHSGEPFLHLVKEQVTLMPVPYAEGEGKKFFPNATIALVMLNVFIFYFIEQSPFWEFEIVADNFAFLPITGTWWNLPVSPFTSMFMHTDAGHLWGNMLFLWAYGPAVEERLGGRKFLFLYLLTGLLGHFFAVMIERVFLSRTYHGWGASGAIAGLMGIFMIRCYFKRLVVPLPLLGLVHIKLRVNSLIPLCLFFLRDLGGGIEQLAGSRASIGYLVHVGSMVSGMLLAARLKLHEAGVEEKYIEIGTRSMEKFRFLADGEGSFRHALELNPDNETALLALARMKAASRNPEGREFFSKAIRLSLKSSPSRAAAIYGEYMTAYNRMLDPDLQYRLAGIFLRRRDFESAIRSLEMVVDEPSAGDALRERAFFQLISALAEHGLPEPARHRLRQFGEAFPRSSLLQTARKKFHLPS